MPKRVVTSLAFIVAVLVLGGAALAAANRVSTKPAPAFVSPLARENARADDDGGRGRGRGRGGDEVTTTSTTSTTTSPATTQPPRGQSSLP